MNRFLRALLATVVAVLFAAAIFSHDSRAQAPPPVPALPDAARINTYSISASTCACSVGFAIYGDGTDVDDWIQVFVGSTAYLSTDPTFGWSLSSVTGSLSTIPRPITNAVLTFTNPQTATVTIVGARRPRRLSQFPENRGVAARDLNQAITDEIAMLRETWDKVDRAIVGQPGEVFNPLPPPSARVGNLLGFDSNGLPAVVLPSDPGNSILAVMPAFTYICNNTAFVAAAQDCGAVTVTFPLSISISTNVLSFAGTFTNDRTYFGFNSGLNAGGVGNTTFGANTLGALTAGSQNSAFGGSALHADTSGSTNAAVGFNSMAANTTGGSNTAVGASSNPISTSNNNNTCVGSNCFLVLSGGNTNTAIGNGAGSSITSGSDNIVVGGIVGTGTHGVTTGSKNITIGKYDNATSSGITTGSQNNILGPATGLSNPSNAIVIADGAGNIRDSYNNVVANAWARGKTDFTDQIYSTTGTPTIASGACGATTNGTVGSGSTNQSGFVSIGAAATTTCTLTWSATLSVAPNSCVFFPGNAAAAATGTTVAFAGAPSTASVILNGTALANTVYRYLCL